MTLSRPRHLLAGLLALVALCAASLLALPAQAHAEYPVTPDQWAYYNARWDECKAKVDWADSGIAPQDRWDGNAGGSQPASGSGTVDDPYLVGTANELRWCLVNKKSLRLVNDIDLGGREGRNWVGPTVDAPVTIDGDGHTVYNLYCHNPGGYFSFGLIGTASHDDFVIKDLTLSSVKVSTTTGGYGQCVASLIGYFYKGTCDGCTVENAIVDGANCLTSGIGGLFAPSQHGAGSVLVIRNTVAKNVNVYGAYCVSDFIEGPWGNSGLPKSLLIENSAAVDGTAISTQGHSGGFTSCVMVTDGAVYRNCFSNVDVYGNYHTGVFVGVTHAGNHVFENCYTSGKIEGTNTIGGFFGYSEGSASERFTNCYSTSMVGMANGGTYMGGFVGAGGATGTYTNCYAAGEVGTLRSSEDGTPLDGNGNPLSNQYVTGFSGNDGGNLVNCYYDMQTTGMCDYGKVAGKVAGVLTRDLIGAKATGATVTLDPDVWATSEGGYPELRAFAESDDPMVRAYSTASTSTVHLYANEAGDDYDTVRKIRYVFPLTSNANSGKGSFNVSWANYVGEDPDNPLYPNVSPILDGDVPIVTLDKVGSADCVTSVAPGIGWLQVNAVDKASGQTGMRRLRLVPTTAIAMVSFGASGLNNMDVVTSLPPSGLDLDGMKVPDSHDILYDHRSTISFVTTSSSSLNSFLLDQSENKKDELDRFNITSNGFPEEATSSIDADGVLVYDLGGKMDNDRLTAVLYKQDADGNMVRVPWTEDLERLLSGERTATAEDCGTYQLSYEWLNREGTVLKAEGSKNVTIGEPAYVVYHWNDGVHVSDDASDDLYEVYAVDPGLYLVGTSVADAFKAVPEREGYDERYWALSPEGDDGVVAQTARAAGIAPLAAPADEFTRDTALHAGRNDVYAVWTANRHDLVIRDESGAEIDRVEVPFDGNLAEFIEATGAKDKLTDPDGVLGWTTTQGGGIVTVGDDTAMPDEDVAVYPVRAARPAVSKAAQNLTHATGENNVGDEIAYRVTARNAAADSCWQGVVISDTLPAGLDLVAGSARLVLADGTTRTLGEDAYDAATRTLSATAGDLRGGQSAVLEFRAVINAKAVDAGEGEQAEANRDLGNIGTASGKDSDGTTVDPTSSDPVVPNPDPDKDGEGGPSTWPVTPFDPEPSIGKDVVNVTDPDGPVQVGDVLEHTVTASNGKPGSVWADVTITDPVPEGLTPVPGSIKIILPDGTVVPVPDGAYDPDKRVITYGPRSIGGGEELRLVYETTVDPEAVDDPSIGSRPSAEGEGPHGDPEKAAADEDAYPEAMEDDPKVYWADPACSTVKTAWNLTRPGEPTRVGDRLRYEVAAENTRADSLWPDVVVYDKLPLGLTPDLATLKLTTADGREIAVPEAAWDERSRTVAVYVGDLRSGQRAAVTFECVVDAGAVGADIGNVGSSYGGLPTPGGEWIEKGPYQPGDAYHPRGGGEDVPTGAATTVPVYPHDSDAENGVLSADGTAADGTQVVQTALALAVTGDDTAATALVAACALLGSSAVLMLRRLHRRRCA